VILEGMLFMVKKILAFSRGGQKWVKFIHTLFGLFMTDLQHLYLF
jgi:hypothetical protein